MPKTIQSTSGQNMLSALITLFQENGNTMTLDEIRSKLPAHLGTEMTDTDLDQAITVLKSYSDTLLRNDASAQDPSLPILNIFSDSLDGSFMLTASDDICDAVMGMVGSSVSPFDIPERDIAYQQKAVSPLTDDAAFSENGTFDDREAIANADEGNSELFDSSSHSSFETLETFETNASADASGTDGAESWQTLEKNLNDASASVAEAAEKAASLKNKSAIIYEETETLSGSDSADKTRQQISDAYQKRMESYQQRVNALQDALNDANAKKDAALEKADASDADLYAMQEEMRSSLTERESLIRKYREESDGNQQHIDELKKALEDARESLENAKAKALASQQQIASLRKDADAYYTYGTEMLNDYQEAADTYEDKIHTMQDQLDAAEAALAESAGKADQAKALSDEYANRLASMQDELDRTKAAYADAADALDASNAENDKLKNDLNGYTQLTDKMVVSYQNDVQGYKDRIAQLQEALEGFRSQADTLKGDVDDLNSDKDQMYVIFQQNLDSCNTQIKSLEDDLYQTQGNLADANQRADASANEASNLKQAAGSFKDQIASLEERLNAALNTIETLRDQNNACNAQNAGLKEDLAALNTANDKLASAYKQDGEDYQSRIDALQQQLDEAGKNLADARNEKDASDQKAGSLKKDVIALQDIRQQMIDAHQNEIDMLQRQVNALKDALLKSHAAMTEAETKADASTQDADSLKAQIGSWQNQINDLNSQLESSRADLADARKTAQDSSDETESLKNDLDGLRAGREEMISKWQQDADDYEGRIKIGRAHV